MLVPVASDLILTVRLIYPRLESGLCMNPRIQIILHYSQDNGCFSRSSTICNNHNVILHCFCRKKMAHAVFFGRLTLARTLIMSSATLKFYSDGRSEPVPFATLSVVYCSSSFERLLKNSFLFFCRRGQVANLNFKLWCSNGQRSATKLETRWMMMMMAGIRSTRGLLGHIKEFGHLP